MPNTSIDWMSPTEMDITLPKDEDLALKCSCICSHCSLYKKWPDCCGCTVKQEMLCFNTISNTHLDKHKRFSSSEGESYCFDFERELMGDEGCQYAYGKSDFCFCCTSKSASTCKMPRTFCAGANQNLCIESRFALPPTAEIPWGIAICGYQLAGGAPATGAPMEKVAGATVNMER